MQILQGGIALALIASLAACKQDLADAPCPCVAGYECCATRNVCLRPGAVCSSVSSGGVGGGVGGGGGVAASHSLPTTPLAPHEIVQFNDDGGWSWLQDERAVVDARRGQIIIGSVASRDSRHGNQEAVIYDIATTLKLRLTLGLSARANDQNAPAFVTRTDGKQIAMWTTGEGCVSHYSVLDGSPSPNKSYDWTIDGCDASSFLRQISYANPWYLSDEDRIYGGIQSVAGNPAFLYSSDEGRSWNFYGQIFAISHPPISGYVKYWGNGTDRIDFIGSESTSASATTLRHGYYKGGKLYDSSDRMIAEHADSGNAPDIRSFTEVFASGSTPAGATAVKLSKLWCHDLVRYSDGTIVMTGQGRVVDPAGNSGADLDKRLIYSRWDGKSWQTTYLVKVGPRLYEQDGDDEDDTGLSAVDPNHPNVIFVSSSHDPRTDLAVPSGVHEIFMGITSDQGASWTWAPLTQNSIDDNIRPIVPKWDSTHTLLLWLRGVYRSHEAYSLEVVGTMALSRFR